MTHSFSLQVRPHEPHFFNYQDNLLDSSAPHYTCNRGLLLSLLGNHVQFTVVVVYVRYSTVVSKPQPNLCGAKVHRHL